MKVVDTLLKLSNQASRNVDYYHLLPVFPMSESMPHNIFQIYLSEKKGHLIPEVKSAIQKIKELNPDWKYNMFDYEKAESFIYSEYGKDILEYFRRIDSHYGAARADFLRYLILYRYGGVYLDVKCLCTIPLSEAILSGDKFILPEDEINKHPEWPDVNGRFYNNCFIVSVAGHPCMRNIILEVMQNIDRYNPYITGIGFSGTILTTGPVAYSNAIYRYCKGAPNQSSVRRCDVKTVFGFTNIYPVGNTFGGGNQYNSFSYQKACSMSDYRKQTSPLIRHSNCFINVLNVICLRIMAKYRKMKQ